MEPLHIQNKEDLINQIQQYSDKLIVFLFSAVWCGPCKMIKKQIYNDETKTGISTIVDNVVFMYIDVDENEELAGESNIQAMPTFIFNRVNKEGKLQKLEEFQGANSKKLNELINKYSN